MSRNYPPPSSNSASASAPSNQPNAPATTQQQPNQRPYPQSHSNRPSQPPISRPGPYHHPQAPHHHNHHHNHRPIQPNRPPANTTPVNQNEPLQQDLFDYKLLDNTDYPFCTDHSKYEHITKIGQGTFGEVYKAKCKKTNEIVALKKVLTENEKEGFPITALREIKILQVLRHENIVRLIEICTTKACASNKYKSQFFLVFEFCEHDLAGLLSNQSIRFTLGEQKKIMQQLLNGLYYIHKNFILHRDMKTANILVTKDGKLKLADFGLARAVVQASNQTAKYTNRVVTLWYRPPELLLGEKCYNKAIDIWGGGCIMAELWTREPILKGSSEQNQLDLIQNLCGSINNEVWPDVEKFEMYNKMNLKPDLKRKIRERLGNYINDANGLDLLDKLLTLDPKKRIDSDEALDHDFFWTEPMPCDLKLDRLNSSMFEYTASRRYHSRQPQRHPNQEQQHYDRVY